MQNFIAVGLSRRARRTIIKNLVNRGFCDALPFSSDVCCSFRRERVAQGCMFFSGHQQIRKCVPRYFSNYNWVSNAEADAQLLLPRLCFVREIGNDVKSIMTECSSSEDLIKAALF
jgi:hypothetical protein